MRRYLYIALLLLIVTSCNKSKQLLTEDVWIFYAFSNNTTELLELDSARHERIVIQFADNGDLILNSIVNNCGGKYKIRNGLQIKDLGCTLIASVDSLDNVLENRFVQALTNSQTFHIIDENLKIQFKLDGEEMNELIFSKNNCAC